MALSDVYARFEAIDKRVSDLVVSLDAGSEPLLNADAQAEGKSTQPLLNADAQADTPENKGFAIRQFTIEEDAVDLLGGLNKYEDREGRRAWRGRSAYMKVFSAGAAFLLPFWSWVGSLAMSKDFKLCRATEGCVYSNFFGATTDDGVHLPAWFFGYVPVTVGKEQHWLANHTVSPSCKGMTKDEMETRCLQIDEQGLAQGIATKTSTRLFQASLIAWTGCRITHDCLLLLAYHPDTTMQWSNATNFVLAIACFFSIIVSWNSLELFYKPLYDGETRLGCGCYFRIGMLTSFGALGVPFGLIGVYQQRIFDIIKAYIGGDYLITLQFHVPHRYFKSLGFNPVRSGLGAAGLGLPASNDIPALDCFDQELPSVEQGDVLFWARVFRACYWALMLFIAFPLPLLAMRGFKIFSVITLGTLGIQTTFLNHGAFLYTIVVLVWVGMFIYAAYMFKYEKNVMTAYIYAMEGTRDDGIDERKHLKDLVLEYPELRHARTRSIFCARPDKVDTLGHFFNPKLPTPVTDVERHTGAIGTA